MEFLRSKIAPSALIIFSLLAGRSFAVEETPRAIRVVLPPALAKKIAQDVIGRPTSHGDKHVIIRVKDPIPANVKINLADSSQALSLYGAKLFGLNLAKPSFLDMKIMNLVAQGDVVVTKIAFSEPPREGGRVFVDADIEMRRLEVTTKEIWVRELGITPAVNAPESTGCKTPKNKLDSFSKGRVYAQVDGARVVSKSARDGEVAVTAHGRFEAAFDGKKLSLKPLSMTHKVAETMGPHYKLLAKISLPPVFIKVGDECYLADENETRKATQAFFDTQRRDLLNAILDGVGDSITEAGMDATVDAIKDLGTIPVEKEFDRKKKSKPFKFKALVALRDATNVVSPSLERARFHELQLATVEKSDADAKSKANKCGPKTDDSGNKNPSVLDEILWNVQEKLSLGSIGTDASGALNIELADRLTLNDKT